MINDLEKIENPKLLSPLVLAYMGDAVYEMLVRERIIKKANMAVKKLHSITVTYVCANAQAKAVDIIYDMLSEEEIEIFKRGRNAHSNTVPKNVNPTIYRRATGFEALLGYLYFKADNKRISELFEVIWTSFEEK